MMKKVYESPVLGELCSEVVLEAVITDSAESSNLYSDGDASWGLGTDTGNGDAAAASFGW